MEYIQLYFLIGFCWFILDPNNIHSRIIRTMNQVKNGRNIYPDLDKDIYDFFMKFKDNKFKMWSIIIIGSLLYSLATWPKQIFHIIQAVIYRVKVTFLMNQVKQMTLESISQIEKEKNSKKGS